jgi:hypothetical protein
MAVVSCSTFDIDAPVGIVPVERELGSWPMQIFPAWYSLFDPNYAAIFREIIAVQIERRDAERVAQGWHAPRRNGIS